MGRRYCKFFSECKKKAVYKIPYTNLYLCKEHFIENLEKRVRRFIEKKHLIHPWHPKYSRYREKILIALSGGKDSQVLLHVMKHLYPDEIIEGIYIELGISHGDYSLDSEKIARATCKKLDIPFHVADLKEEYGFSIDDIYELKNIFHENNWSLGSGHFRGQCSYCGTFKRYLINKYAAEHDFTCVATGHNLTDETTSLINNFFNQNMLFLSRMDYKSDADIEKLVPRIKPLYYITEEEITVYAYFANVNHLPTECVYAKQANNLKLKDVLSEIESYRKGTMISLMKRYQKVLKPIVEDYMENQSYQSENKHNKCNQCGFPTFANRCNFCKTVNFLQDRFRQAENRLDINIFNENAKNL